MSKEGLGYQAFFVFKLKLIQLAGLDIFYAIGDDSITFAGMEGVTDAR